MTALPLVHSTGAVLISSRALKEIPGDLTDVLRTRFAEAMRALTVQLRAQNEEAVKLVRESGLTVMPLPTGADLDAFYAVHDRVAKKLTGEVYPKEVLDRVYAILETHR
jgi:TRAP-type C4-dicarboxylate transport system substrate-binding protein